MPILEPDPWRKSFFSKYACPDNLLIPTKDTDAYVLNPDYSWAYNKLRIAEIQGLSCGPHGIEPKNYPTFSKPIYNVRSMGAGSGIIRNAQEMKLAYNPGYMWVDILTGEHLSTDIAVVDGQAVWFAHSIGHAGPGGTFDYWEISPCLRPDIEAYFADFISTHFQFYTGMLNFETINKIIIEVHLRFADQWPDLYGHKFVPSLIALYQHSKWDVPAITRKAFSVPLFCPHQNYRKPQSNIIESFLESDEISSIQLPFYEGVDCSEHSMPPGGFRVGIINGYSLKSCLSVRTSLKLLFAQYNGYMANI